MPKIDPATFRQFHWFAVRTMPQREFVAETLLDKAGYCVFNPVEMVERRLNRYRKITEAQPRAMLTSMLLCGFEQSVPPWFTIFQIRPVVGVLGVDGGPIEIRHKAIERMLRLTGKLGDLRNRVVADPEPEPIIVGENALITGGPFDGFSGEVVACRNRRALLLLQLSHADILSGPIEVPVGMLSRVS